MIARIESLLRRAVSDLGPLHTRPMEGEGWRFDRYALPPELKSLETRNATAGERPTNVMEFPR